MRRELSEFRVQVSGLWMRFPLGTTAAQIRSLVATHRADRRTANAYEGRWDGDRVTLLPEEDGTPGTEYETVTIESRDGIVRAWDMRAEDSERFAEQLTAAYGEPRCTDRKS